jgi:predicted phosphoribosyltransferase
MSGFADRIHAGRVLAGVLRSRGIEGDAVVLGLARGGVPVAAEVARGLDLPLDVFVVRKIGVPGHEELALGAIASGGVRVLNLDVLSAIAVPDEVIEDLTAREREELERREREYRDGGTAVDVRGRAAILVDDGLATGSSMRAAVEALRRRDAGRIVVAVPVAPPAACAELERSADEVVCARTPEPFMAVGAWYDDFRQVTDEDVRRLLGGRSGPSGG